jgi:tRNA-2-methylthio-N6-dimethylallyladenosine synthase
MMNRKHKVDIYYRVVEALRHARPDMALSSDFIVGYPGESDKDFEDTMTLVRQVGYAQAFSFKYSPRAGTPAAMHEDKIPEHVKQERLNALQALLAEQQALFNTLSVGLTMPVLMERHGREQGSVVGRTPYMQLVHTTGAAVGECVDIAITHANQNSVRGSIAALQQTEKVA